MRLLAFAGSLRRASFNKKAIAVVARGARMAGAEVNEIDLRDFPMPLYDGDWEAARGLPDAAKAFKRLLVEHDGILVATPEYNSQFPALLKNAFDWASRREGDEAALRAYQGKVAGVTSASPGAMAGLRGQAALRAQLAYLGMVVVPHRVGIAMASEAFDQNDDLRDPALRRLTEELGAITARFASRLGLS